MQFAKVTRKKQSVEAYAGYPVCPQQHGDSSKNSTELFIKLITGVGDGKALVSEVLQRGKEKAAGETEATVSCVYACVYERLWGCGSCGVAWRPEVHVDKSHFVQRTTSGLGVVAGVAICGYSEQGKRSTRWNRSRSGSGSRDEAEADTSGAAASFMNFTWRRVAYPTLWFIVLLPLLLLLVVCQLRICIEGQCGTTSTIVVAVLCCVALCAVRV